MGTDLQDMSSPLKDKMDKNLENCIAESGKQKNQKQPAGCAHCASVKKKRKLMKRRGPSNLISDANGTSWKVSLTNIEDESPSKKAYESPEGYKHSPYWNGVYDSRRKSGGKWRLSLPKPIRPPRIISYSIPTNYCVPPIPPVPENHLTVTTRNVSPQKSDLSEAETLTASEGEPPKVDEFQTDKQISVEPPVTLMTQGEEVEPQPDVIENVDSELKDQTPASDQVLLSLDQGASSQSQNEESPEIAGDFPICEHPGSNIQPQSCSQEVPKDESVKETPSNGEEPTLREEGSEKAKEPSAELLVEKEESCRDEMVTCDRCKKLIKKRRLWRHLQSKTCICAEPPPDKILTKEQSTMLNLAQMRDTECRDLLLADPATLDSLMCFYASVEDDNQISLRRFLNRASMLGQFLLSLKLYMGTKDAAPDWHKIFIPESFEEILAVLRETCELLFEGNYYEFVPRINTFLTVVIAKVKDRTPIGQTNQNVAFLYMLKDKELPKLTWQQKERTCQDILLTLQGLTSMVDAFVALLQVWSAKPEAERCQLNGVLVIKRLYRGLLESLVALICLYNGRRQTWVLKMKLADFQLAQRNTYDVDLLKNFSNFQRQTARDIYCITSGLEKPILITRWLHSKVSKMLSFRGLAGVDDLNDLLFASPKERTGFFEYYPCSYILSDLQVLIELTDPERTRGKVSVMPSLQNLSYKDLKMVQTFIGTFESQHKHIPFEFFKGALFETYLEPFFGPTLVENNLDYFEQMSFREMKDKLGLLKEGFAPGEVTATSKND